jgi:sugar (pentulose or hexulose) kinase
MSADRILAIDVGTRAARALLFDGQGELVGRASVPFEPYLSSTPGWAEYDPELFWQAIGDACRGLWASEEVEPSSVAGVTLTTQRGTVVCTDAEGRPLRPAIIWLDQRRTTGHEPIGGLTGLSFRTRRVSDMVAAFQADAEVNWLRRHEPEIWSRTAHYLLLSGFLNHRLTGRFVDSTAAQVGYLPFDYKRLQWAGTRNWKWQVAPVGPHRLPELVGPTERLGDLTADAAAHLGLSAGLPVIAAATDQACQVLGSGAIEPHIGAVSLGATATFTTTQRRYVEAIPTVPPHPSAVPGAWSLELQVERGFWMVEWFKREFATREKARAKRRRVEPESLMDELVAATPPGSMGLVLQPSWSPGAQFPGPDAKGAIIGFGDVHTRAHLYRAILEGLAYALRDGAERTARRTGIGVTELRVSGGGARSPAAMQVTADVFGLPAGSVQTHETSGLGAAIDAAVGLGWYPNVEAAARAMIRVGDVREPDATAHAVYDALYRQVYRRMYAALRPLYKEIRRITGYPGAT